MMPGFDPTRAHILVVDDQPANVRLLVRTLEQEGYLVSVAHNGARALTEIHAHPIDLVLLDIMMPHTDGYEVCRQLKADATTRDIPVIFVSALDEVLDKVRAFDVGGVDYVTKPFRTQEVSARVRTHLELRYLRQNLERQNAQLQMEVAERRRVEQELKLYQGQLEVRVQERTHALEAEAAERQEIERALQTSAEEFRAIFEQAAVGLSHSTLEGHFIRINRRLCDITGYTQAELRQMTFQDITHPADLTADLELMQELLDGGRPSYILEKRYVRKDGSVIWVKLTVSLKRTEQGDPEYFIGVVEDISRRKAAEAALRQSKEAYQMITELSRDLISLHDVEGRFLYASAVCVELLGYAPAMLTGHSAYEFIHPEAVESVQQHHRRVLSGEEIMPSFSYRIRRAGGDYIWFESIIRVADVPGMEPARQILAVSRDVTGRKQMEAQLQAHTENLERLVQEKIRELEQTRAKMIQTAKLASLGEMATGVAHVLNQPLTAMLFDADYLQRLAQRALTEGVPIPPAEVLEIGQDLQEDVQRSRRITDYLRAFRQLTKGATLLCNVNAPIEDSFILTESRLSQNHIFVTRNLAADLPEVLIHPHQLEQVLLNLISNAEFALAEMEARIKAGAVLRENYQKRLEVVSYAEAAQVVIEVRDNGCGIPEAIREQIFDPFFSTRPQVEGAGLSLYISQASVQEFGGTITFETEENLGTTFIIRIPAAE